MARARKNDRIASAARQLAAALACVLAATPALASVRQVEGVSFDDRVRVEGVDLELRGLGLLRYRVIFRAYVAALYAEPGVAGEAVLGDVAKRLEIEYFWPIGAEDFVRASQTMLGRNVEPARLGVLRSRLERLHAAYRDVRPGDRYVLTYVPGRGTELALNDQPLVLIPGEDFAQAYFSIWLGEDPVDAGMREQLLAVR